MTRSIRCTTIIALLTFSGASYSETSQRGIFLNGIDISSAKHQTLENVTLRIDGQGHIYIEAPHYEVNEESTYIPLSSWNREGMGLPEHKPHGPIPDAQKTFGTAPPLPRLSKEATPLSSEGTKDKVEKQGDKNQGQLPGSPADGEPNSERKQQ